MPHIITSKGQPSSMAERIAKRLRNSGDVKHADVSTSHGTGPTRTYTQIHHSGNHVAPRDVRNVDIRSASKQKPPSER
jgi:hypothetical protein